MNANPTDSIYDAAARALLCFDCRSHLRWNGQGMECSACSSCFPVETNLIHRRADFHKAYGHWFKEGASHYEEDHNLSPAWSNWIATVTVGVLSRYTCLPARLALEIGCGTGVLTRGYLAQNLAEGILATDISAEMLAEAAKNTPSRRVMFCVQDVHDLTVSPSSVDIVAGGSILHHLADLPACLRQINQALAPGGVAIFLEPFFAGNRMLTYLLRFALAEVASNGQAAQLRQLQSLLASQTRDLEYRHQHRQAPEMLAPLEDKHLFIREELKPVAVAAGFETVVFESLYDVSPVVRETVMRDIAMDIAATLLREAQAEGSISDLLPGGLLDEFSHFYAEFFLSDFSPQEFCIFVKP